MYCKSKQHMNNIFSFIWRKIHFFCKMCYFEFNFWIQPLWRWLTRRRLGLSTNELFATDCLCGKLRQIPLPRWLRNKKMHWLSWLPLLRRGLCPLKWAFSLLKFVVSLSVFHQTREKTQPLGLTFPLNNSNVLDPIMLIVTFDNRHVPFDFDWQCLFVLFHFVSAHTSELLWPALQCFGKVNWLVVSDQRGFYKYKWVAWPDYSMTDWLGMKPSRCRTF